eukprot:tig00020912_g15810.t1
MGAPSEHVAARPAFARAFACQLQHGGSETPEYVQIAGVLIGVYAQGSRATFLIDDGTGVVAGVSWDEDFFELCECLRVQDARGSFVVARGRVSWKEEARQFLPPGTTELHLASLAEDNERDAEAKHWVDVVSKSPLAGTPHASRT